MEFTAAGIEKLELLANKEICKRNRRLLQYLTVILHRCIYYVMPITTPEKIENENRRTQKRATSA